MKKVSNMESAKNRTRENVIALLIYCLVVAIANWSILAGTNLMKWDIWDAHYPMQVLVSDAMKSGQLPIWNPLINFGTPHYAQVGTPVWYFVTLIIDVFGYGPNSPAVEYSVHMVIAAMGMFWLDRDLIMDEGKDELRRSEFASSIICGVLYAFSGIFLSNAQHIMIIISAAWTPYVLLFAKRAVMSHKAQRLLSIMETGICAGFILLGGYPEQFYDVFLVSFVWTFFWVKKSVGNGNWIGMLWESMKIYLSVAVATILSAAITVVPFVGVMGKITRSGGQSLFDFPFFSAFSMLFPVTIDRLSGLEISMGLFYVGFITIAVLPLIKNHKKSSLAYVSFALLALYLCFGSNSLIYKFLYKFFPMYSTFRFPTVWRVHFALFMVLAISDILTGLQEGNDNDVFANALKKLGTFILEMSIIIYAGSYLIEAESTKNALLSLKNASLILLCVLVVYYLYNEAVRKGKLRGWGASYMLIIIVCAEVLCVSYKAMPVMIAGGDAKRYYQDSGYKEGVDDAKQAYINRNAGSDFKDSGRSISGRNSQYLALNKSFDEDGYVSVLLAKTEEYKQSYNRSIIQQNPEMFFSNDIVTSKDVDLQEWKQRPDISSYQIYVDEVKNLSLENIKTVKAPDSNVCEENVLEMNVGESGYVYVEGNYKTKSTTTSKIRVYLQDEVEECSIDTKFTRAIDEVEVTFAGTYPICRDVKKQCYIDIPFPQVSTEYNKVEFASQNVIGAVSIVELEKNVKDSNVDVEKFGYNQIKASVNAPTDGMAVLLQANYDGWNVYVDGKKTDIQEVDGCFLGVPLKQGTHTIEFVFSPWDFKIGVMISLVYWMTFVVVYIYVVRKK